jgi:small-conductance mechanosensitive channel
VVGAGLFFGFVAIWGLVRARRTIEGRLDAISRRALATTGGATSDALHTSRLIAARRGLATAITSVIGIVFIYWIVTFVLRQLPYTRVWGESMRGFLLATFARLGLDLLRAIPGLFTAALIFLAVRFAVRLVDAWFNAVERGSIRLKWMYPETAVPSRRLVTILLWVFGIIVAYPYLPGSQTEAFKGVSVFLGLMLTFGSSGIVNQLMSGFMITYSRALRPGNYVKIGDVTGTVTHLGVLSTKIKTARREEVTIPNAVVVSQTATDYTRFSETEGVLTPTSVTIGYDAPWRQVHSLLLLAAERTPGLRAEPKPFVVQAALEDFYVNYTLLVSLERQDARVLTLNALHGQIQDVFNEHGVQIMSPHYEQDPKTPKIVAAKDWFAPPARPEDR